MNRTQLGPAQQPMAPPFSDLMKSKQNPVEKRSSLISTNLMRVLVVEDEAGVCEFLQQALEESGCEVVVCSNGPDGLHELVRQPFDVALLDIMLPGMDGLAVLKTARLQGVQTPVMLLTARNETGDKVAGLDLGADDYLAKPFRIEELVARVRALARRSRNHVLTAADLSMDTLRRTVDRSGRALYLSPTEFSVLQLLLERQGQPVSKRDILAYVWRDDATRDPNTVEVYINYLRNKLEAGGATRLIHTQRGAGYVLSSQEPDES